MRWVGLRRPAPQVHGRPRQPRPGRVRQRQRTRLGVARRVHPEHRRPAQPVRDRHRRRVAPRQLGFDLRDRACPEGHCAGRSPGHREHRDHHRPGHPRLLGRVDHCDDHHFCHCARLDDLEDRADLDSHEPQRDVGGLGVRASDLRAVSQLLRDRHAPPGSAVRLGVQQRQLHRRPGGTSPGRQHV